MCLKMKVFIGSITCLILLLCYELLSPSVKLYYDMNFINNFLKLFNIIWTSYLYLDVERNIQIFQSSITKIVAVYPINKHT